MDELLDIVNDEDLVVDRQMRSTVHELGLQHRGVHVLLFAHDGKMLVQKRSADRAACPSALDCSVSEHVKTAETYLNAAIRGMQEELGVEAIELKPLVTFRMNYGPNDNEISTTYEGMVDPRAVRFDPVEIESVGSYSIAELTRMIDENEIRFCGWFVEILNWYLKRPSQLKVLKTY
jgi:isopentenyl-diphosphate delta-isomerase